MPWIARAAVDSQPFGGEVAAAPHRGEQVTEHVTWLGRAGRPAGDGDGAAGDQCGGKERRRVGQVRLHVHRAGAQRPRMHPPGVGAGALDPHPGVVQHPDCHRHVRRGRDGRTLMVYLYALVETRAREQQRGDQLG